jgi:ATP-dependent Clp protease ATP-binding subunit ClpA
VNVNCRGYFAGRFPPLPRAKIEGGPLAVISVDGVEALPEIPPVAALWADAIRYGRAALPAANERGEVTQVELSFGRAIIVGTANVAREQAIHIGFHPEEAKSVAPQEADRLIQDALAGLFHDTLSDVFSQDRWIVLPPLDRAGMRRLVSLQLENLAEQLPKGSPPIEITDEAATALIDQALASHSPNKTVSLVDLIRGIVGPAVDRELLRAAAPVALRVQITLEGGAVLVRVEQTVATR